MKRVLLTLIILCTTTLYAQQAKYVFFFIGDGMGINTVQASRYYKSYLAGEQSSLADFSFTSFPVFGISTTNAATRYITDSAAAGTALATGTKTSPGTIGMNSDHTENLRSMAYDALEGNKAVGIVTTMNIDHATPAAFYANQTSRDMGYEIAMDAPESGFDLFAGAGFSETEKEDKPEVYQALKEAGYMLIRGENNISKINAEKVVITEHSSFEGSTLEFAIDRKEGDLSLQKLVKTSIDYLYNKEGKGGFFLMAEGGSIDIANHRNDAKTAMMEVWDLEQSIQLAYDFYKKHPNETLIVVTADHETGGFALGNYELEYDLNLNLLAQQKISRVRLAELIEDIDSWQECKELLTKNLSLWQEVEVTDSETEELKNAFEDDKDEVAVIALRILSLRSGIGWSTHKHTGSVVGVYAIGVGSEKFIGEQDNTEISEKIKSAL